jgi:alanine racemase
MLNLTLTKTATRHSQILVDWCNMRPAWLEINLDALAHNLALLRQRAAGVPAIGVVKANAYGHGALEIGRELVRLGVWGLGVATVDEARALREGGIKAPILLLGSLHPSQAEEVLPLDLVVTLSTLEAAKALDAAAGAVGRRVEVHLKLDTGMNRVGFAWEEAKGSLEALQHLPNLRVSGIYSHLASSDEDVEQTRGQLQRMNWIREVLGGHYLYHLANSGGVLFHPETTLQAIRPGIALYGLVPDQGLKPVARLLAKPTLVKRVAAGERVGYGGTYTMAQEGWIATLPVGYADGIPRALSNRGQVRLEGTNCPIVGRVSMDQTTVLIPGPVELHQVFEVIAADYSPASLVGWATLTDSVPYEPAVRLAPRLPRVYVRGGIEVAQTEA